MSNAHSRHAQMVEELLAETRAAGGLAPVDLDRFWADQEKAIQNLFGATIPQVPLGIMMSGECVYAELGIEEDFRRYSEDHQWRLSLNKVYNDKAEQIVGRRLLSEDPPPDPALLYPPVKGLHDVFDAKNEWHAGSWWLRQSARNEDELKSLLDRVEKRDIRSFILPSGWDKAKARLMPMGIKPPTYPRPARASHVRDLDLRSRKPALPARGQPGPGSPVPRHDPADHARNRQNT